MAQVRRHPRPRGEAVAFPGWSRRTNREDPVSLSRSSDISAREMSPTSAANGSPGSRSRPGGRRRPMGDSPHQSLGPERRDIGDPDRSKVPGQPGPDGDQCLEAGQGVPPPVGTVSSSWSMVNFLCHQSLVLDISSRCCYQWSGPGKCWVRTGWHGKRSDSLRATVGDAGALPLD